MFPLKGKGLQTVWGAGEQKEKNISFLSKNKSRNLVFLPLMMLKWTSGIGLKEQAWIISPVSSVHGWGCYLWDALDSCAF